MSHILVVEDDPAVLRGLVMNLEMEGHTVSTATDGEAGLASIREIHPDLVILDVMLPRQSGFEVCRKARELHLQLPILLLTARGEEGDRVRGLDLGADDYVSKPFSLPELLARVRALLRRSAAHLAASQLDALSFDDVEVDFLNFGAFKSGKPVDLTRKEFALLRALSSNPGQVMTRDELLNRVWGYEHYPTTRTVDNHVMLLRSKLSIRRIETIHGIGYKWLP